MASWSNTKTTEEITHASGLYSKYCTLCFSTQNKTQALRTHDIGAILWEALMEFNTVYDMWTQLVWRQIWPLRFTCIVFTVNVAPFKKLKCCSLFHHSPNGMEQKLLCNTSSCSMCPHFGGLTPRHAETFLGATTCSIWQVLISLQLWQLWNWCSLSKWQQLLCVKRKIPPY